MSNLQDLLDDIVSFKKHEEDTVLVLVLDPESNELKVATFGDEDTQANDMANLMLKNESLMNLVHDLVEENNDFENSLNKLL